MVSSIAFLAIFRKAGAPELCLRAKHLGDPTGEPISEGIHWEDTLKSPKSP